MRQPDKRASASYRMKAARPTPAYDDEVSAAFIGRQQAHIDSTLPENFQLTPVSEDGW